MSSINISTRSDLIVFAEITTPQERSAEQKRIRRSTILDIVRTQGPLTHGEVARLAGLNFRTARAHLEELIDDKLVVQEEATQRTVGRPAPNGRLNGKGASCLGLSLSNGHLSVGIIDLNGDDVFRGEAKLPETADETIPKPSAIIEALDQAMKKAKTSAIPPVAGVGVAVQHRFARESLAGYEVPYPSAGTAEAALVRVLEAELDVPILVDLQARANAIASFWFGVGQDFEKLVFLDLTNAPFATLIENRRVYQGHLGQAGDLGSVPISFFSEPEVIRGDDMHLDKVAELSDEEQFEGMTFEKLVAAAKSKDYGALNAINRYAEYLAQVSASPILMMAPSGFVLGGSAVSSRSAWANHFQQSLEKVVPGDRLLTMDMAYCDYGAENPAHAAAALVYQQIFAPQSPLTLI